MVNFYVAILILKMEENTHHLWHIVLDYFKKGKNATEVQKTMCAVWRRCCDGLNGAGDFSLGDAPRVGSPAEVESDQIKTLIESNQRYTMQEIPDILKIMKTIKLIVKMKMCLFFYRKKKSFWST